jgi:hypothetical protein
LKKAGKLILAGNVKETASGNNISNGDNFFTSCFLKQTASEITLALAGCLRKRLVETRFALAVFLSNRQWKALAVFLSTPLVLMLFSLAVA